MRAAYTLAGKNTINTTAEVESQTAVYSITETGHAELLKWSSTPVKPNKVNDATIL